MDRALTPDAVLGYLADLAPAGRPVLDVVTRVREFVYLGWKPDIVGPARLLPEAPSREVRAAGLTELAALDGLHASERLLRAGWLFVVGTIEWEDKPTRFCIPLLSAPVRIIRLGFGVVRVVPADDPEMPGALFEEAARTALEDDAPFGGGASEPDAALLARLPRLSSWVESATKAAGLGSVPLLTPGVDPVRRRTEAGLAVVAGAAVYTARDVRAPGMAAVLRAWRGEDLSATALEAVYEAGEQQVGTSTERIRSPLPLNESQREAARRSRRERVTVVSGPPGTGKSHTVAALAIDEVGRGNSVLVATQSDHAADVVAALLDRHPGPRFVRFGSGEHRRRVADELAEGMATPYGFDELRRLETDLLRSERRLDDLRALVERLLEREGAFVEGLARREALAAVATVAPRVGEERLDIGRLRRRLARMGGRGWRARWSARRLRRALGAAAGTGAAELRLAVDLLEAESAVRAGLEGGGLVLAPLWQEFEAAELRWRYAAGHAIEGRRRAAEGSRRASGRSVTALATALRAGRSTRRTMLRELRAHRFLDVLPLWVGTLDEIDDSLPVVPGMFDVVVFDEASQVDQFRAAPALARARRVVVVGDPRQLRHVSFVSDEAMVEAALRHGMEREDARILDVRRNSLFDVATAAAPVSWLDEHFRSVPHIIGFSNREFYEGRLRLMTTHPSTEGRDAIQVIRVAGTRRDDGVNRAELAAVRSLVQELAERGAEQIGLISPFRAQADALEAMALELFTVEEIDALGLRVGTVHGFQGDERDVVVCSLAIGPDDGPQALRFVEDPNLFNVMVTRARAEMIVVTSLDAEDLRDGLLRRYLRHADRPPVGGRPTRPADGWMAELTAALAPYGVPTVVNYPVAGWEVDLVVGEGKRALALECGVHPDGPPDHIERHLALRRAGWTVDDAFLSRWLLATDRAARDVASRWATREAASDP